MSQNQSLSSLKLGNRKRHANRRWNLSVTAGSIMLFAALLIIGLQVAAKMQSNVARATSVHQAHAVVRTPPPPVQSSHPVGVPLKTDKMTEAVSESHHAVMPSAAPTNTSECASLAAQYEGLVSNARATKPTTVPVKTALGSVSADLLTKQYDARATAYNDTLAKYHAEYSQKVAMYACNLAGTPFLDTDPAPII